MKKSSWNLIDWKYAKELAKKPFLFINRHINRYSLTQDKSPKYLSGKKKWNSYIILIL